MVLTKSTRDDAVAALKDHFFKAATKIIEFNKTHSFVLLSTSAKVFVTGLSDFAGAPPHLSIWFWDKNIRGLVHRVEFEDWEAVGDQVGLIDHTVADPQVIFELETRPEPESDPEPDPVAESDPEPVPCPETTAPA